MQLIWGWKVGLSLKNNCTQQSSQRSFLKMQPNKQGQKEEVQKVLKKLLLLFGYAFKDDIFSFFLTVRVNPTKPASIRAGQPAWPVVATQTLHSTLKLNLPWNEEQLDFKIPQSSSSIYFIQDQDCWLECWTRALMINDIISAYTWFEKAVVLKSVFFLESLSLQLLQLLTTKIAKLTKPQ